MTNRGLSRRQFLLCSALCSAYPLSGQSRFSNSDTGPAPGTDSELIRFAYLLFPHPGVPGSVYMGIVNGMVDQAAGNPSLRNAMDQLKAALGKEWLSLPESRQVEKMRVLEAEPFFGVLRSQIAGALYEQQEVWRVIRYDGPSLQYGGYKAKGTGSMEWLDGAGT